MNLRSFVYIYCGGEIRRDLISKAPKPREKGVSRLCLALNTVVRLLAQGVQFNFCVFFEGAIQVRYSSIVLFVLFSS